MYAVSVDGTMYGFRNSPLGLLIADSQVSQ